MREELDLPAYTADRKIQCLRHSLYWWQIFKNKGGAIPLSLSTYWAKQAGKK